MRVTIDGYIPAKPFGGLVSYMAAVTRSLADAGVDIELLVPSGKTFDVHRRLESDRVAVRSVDLRLDDRLEYEGREWADISLPAMLHQIGPDVHFGPAFILPENWRGPKVVTVPDAMFILFPQYFRAAIRSYLNMSTLRAIDVADVVIAVSEASRRDIARIWHPVAPIVTTYLAANVSVPVASCSSPLSNPYILYVGGSHQRKRLDTLVHAFELLVAEESIDTSVELVLVGCGGEPRVETLVEKSSARRRILLTGDVPDTELAVWYKFASLFVYPSEYEGFGLTPLEAMTCGIPVVTSANSSLQEVLGDAAIFADCRSAPALAGSIRHVLSSPGLAGSLSRAGLRRSKRFSWASTARETVSAFDLAIDLSGRR